MQAALEASDWVMEQDLFRCWLSDGSRLLVRLSHLLSLIVCALLSLSSFCDCSGSGRPRPLDYTTINNSQLTPVSKEGWSLPGTRQETMVLVLKQLDQLVHLLVWVPHIFEAAQTDFDNPLYTMVFSVFNYLIDHIATCWTLSLLISDPTWRGHYI